MDDTREVKMQVSSVCSNKNEQYAFVSFTDDTRTAEGKIPDCIVIRNNGFTDEETDALEEYMKMNLATLKRMASEIRPIDAFLK